MRPRHRQVARPGVGAHTGEPGERVLRLNCSNSGGCMLDMVIDARAAALGPGFKVARILPYRKRRMVGPFIFLDHAGPVSMAPLISEEMDVLPHPHIGLSTITYIFHGKWMHRDSVGYEQVIKPGDVNWMTAGSGVSHSERFEEEFRRTGGDLE